MLLWENTCRLPLKAQSCGAYSSLSAPFISIMRVLIIASLIAIAYSARVKSIRYLLFLKYKLCPFGLGLRKFALDSVVIFKFGIHYFWTCAFYYMNIFCKKLEHRLKPNFIRTWSYHHLRFFLHFWKIHNDRIKSFSKWTGLLIPFFLEYFWEKNQSFC